MLKINTTHNAQLLLADSEVRACVAPLNTMLPNTKEPPPVRDAS